MAKQSNTDKTIKASVANVKKRDPQEKLAGYLYDISKLTFAALVLGAFSPLVNGNDVDYFIVIGGGLLTVFFAFTANRIMQN